MTRGEYSLFQFLALFLRILSKVGWWALWEVVDKLFILRGIIDHVLYSGKERCVVIFNTEKCFDSLWMEDSTNSCEKMK